MISLEIGIPVSMKQQKGRKDGREERKRQVGKEAQLTQGWQIPKRVLESICRVTNGGPV